MVWRRYVVAQEEAHPIRSSKFFSGGLGIDILPLVLNGAPPSIRLNRCGLALSSFIVRTWWSSKGGTEGNARGEIGGAR